MDPPPVAAPRAQRSQRTKAPNAGAHHTSACAAQRPTALKFKRADGRTFGVLSWKPGPRAPQGARYRVTRNATVVGQTRRHSMRVNVVLGRRYRFAVHLFLASGTPSRCVTQLQAQTSYRLPSAPQWLSASPATGATVTVTWRPSERGDGALVGYRVLRNRVVVGQTKATSLTVPISSNATYTFTVVAVDSNGRLSAPSAPVDVQTGQSAPPAPAALAAGTVTGTTVSLSWAPSQPARGTIGGYRVLRNGVTVGEYKTTSAQITNLTPATTYTFTVVAVDSLGYVSAPSAPVSVQTGPYQPPSTPQWLSASDASGPTVTISWQASAPGDAAVAGYRVMCNGAVYGQTKATSLTVPISTNATYTFTVVAVDSNGRLSVPSAPVEVQTGHSAPPAPAALAAGTVTGTTVSLSWAPSQPVRGTIGGYRVLRDGVTVGEYNATSAQITNLTPATTYTFTVVAVDSLGYVSAPSAPVSVQTGPYQPPSTPQWLSASDATGPTVTISWQASTPGDAAVAGYRVMRDGAVYGQIATTSLTVPVSDNADYTFTVVAVDSNGQLSAPSAAVEVQTGHSAPPAPAGLQAAALADGTVSLSWAPSQPARGTIGGYRVLRDGVIVGEYNTTSAQITNLTPSTAYTFTVVAVDSLGYVSDPSSAVTVTSAAPIATTGHAYAFLLASTDQSFQDFQAHYMEIGTVSPTYYDCSASGSLTGANDPLITGWAQARGVRVLPRFNCQNSVVIDEIVNSPNLSQQWVSDIVGQVTSNGYDGATLDFEAGYASDRNAYTAFVTSLAAALHADGKLLMLCVSAKKADVKNNPRWTFFDYNSLSAQVDTMFVMGWGIHWTTSAPGAQDDMTWERPVLQYISTLPRVNKYVLGLQLYAMDSPNGGGAANPASSYQYADAVALAASLGVTPTYNRQLTR